MFQYERQYPWFSYLRTLPVDAFAAGASGCVIGDLCRLDVGALRKSGKRMLGAVMNLDRHNQPGSHWVAFAIDLRKRAIMYYDSFGRPPPAELRAFFERVREESPSRYTCNSVYNAVVHQRRNTECGIFATIALEALLGGTPFEKYCAGGVTDEHAFAQRARLFSKM